MGQEQQKFAWQALCGMITVMYRNLKSHEYSTKDDQFFFILIQFVNGYQGTY